MLFVLQFQGFLIRFHLLIISLKPGKLLCLIQNDLDQSFFAQVFKVVGVHLKKLYFSKLAHKNLQNINKFDRIYS